MKKIMTLLMIAFSSHLMAFEIDTVSGWAKELGMTEVATQKGKSTKNKVNGAFQYTLTGKSPKYMTIGKLIEKIKLKTGKKHISYEKGDKGKMSFELTFWSDR